MDTTLIALLWSLLEKVGLAFLLVYGLAQTRYLRQVLSGTNSTANRAIMVVFFGVLSVLGTYTGEPLPSGAIVNIRDTAPMIAGLVGGPVVGLGAGLIGGIHRYAVGGATALPCATTTIVAGLLAGLIYYRTGRKIISAHWAILYAIGIMALEMGLILIMVQPFEKALPIVQAIALPMFVANAVGTGAMVFMLRRAPAESRQPRPVTAVVSLR